MQKIEAFFSPTVNVEVLEKTLFATGVQSLSLVEMRVLNKGASKTEKYRGVERIVRNSNKIKAEIVADSSLVQSVINVIATLTDSGDNERPQAFITDLSKPMDQPIQ